MLATLLGQWRVFHRGPASLLRYLASGRQADPLDALASETLPCHLRNAMLDHVLALSGGLCLPLHVTDLGHVLGHVLGRYSFRNVLHGFRLRRRDRLPATAQAIRFSIPKSGRTAFEDFF